MLHAADFHARTTLCGAEVTSARVDAIGIGFGLPEFDDQIRVQCPSCRRELDRRIRSIAPGPDPLAVVRRSRRSR